MAEIIRPFPSSGTAASGNGAPGPHPQTDSRIVALRLEMDRLEAARTEALRKYEEARRAFEKQKQISTELHTKLKRKEELLPLEESKLAKANEVIQTFQRQWGQMVENDRKLRTAFSELQAHASRIEASRQKTLEEKASAETELANTRSQNDSLAKTQKELEIRNHQLQESFVALEKQSDDDRYHATLIQHELESARQALTKSDSSNSGLRNDLSEARFRIEQLKRELELAQVREQELDRIGHEALNREKRCREEITHLKAEIADMTATLKLQRDVNADTKQQLSNAERAYEQLMLDRANLVRRGDEAYESMTHLKAEIETLTSASQGRENALIRERNTAVENSDRIQAELTAKIQETEAILSATQTRCADLQAQITATSAQLESVTQAIQIEQTSHAATRESVARSEALHAQLMKDRADLVKRGDLAYEEVAHVNKKLEEAIRQSRGAIEAITNERNSALQSASCLEAELSVVRNDLRRMEQERIDSECQQDSMKAEIDRLKSELQAHVKSTANVEQSEQKLGRELEQTRNLVQRLSEDRSALIESNSGAHAENHRLQKELSESREQLRQAQAEMNNLKAALNQNLTFAQQLDKDRARVLSELNDARHSADHLKSELKQLAQKMIQSEVTLSKKAETSEMAKAALWEELTRAEEASAQAQREAVRLAAELNHLRKSDASGNNPTVS